MFPEQEKKYPITAFSAEFLFLQQYCAANV